MKSKFSIFYSWQSDVNEYKIKLFLPVSVHHWKTQAFLLGQAFYGFKILVSSLQHSMVDS